MLQLAAIATFGAGATRDPYNAETDPTVTTELLGRKKDLWLLGTMGVDNDVGVYLAWTYWAAVVADILTVLAGVLFVVTAVCVHRKL